MESNINSLLGREYVTSNGQWSSIGMETEEIRIYVFEIIMDSYTNGRSSGGEMLLASSMDVFENSKALDYFSDCIAIDYEFDGKVLSILLSIDPNKILTLPQFVDLRGMIAFSRTGMYSQYLREKQSIKEYCSMI